MSSTTTNLGLVKMASGETIGQWSDANNGSGANLDKIDTAIGNLNSQIATDWTGCSDYKETIETSANVVLQSFGKLRVLIFQGVSRTHTEDEILMTLPTQHRPLGGNSIYAAGSIGSTPVVIRLNGSDGKVALFIANGATATARIYFQMSWIAA